MKKQILHRFPRRKAAYRGYRERRVIAQKPVQTPMGFWLAGNAAMQSGEFEPVESEFVRSLLTEVNVLINIAANIGDDCCLGLSAKKDVLAFEPLPANLALRMRNVELNGWQNQIQIFPLALANEMGVVEIFGSGTAASFIEGWAGQSTENRVKVRTSALDRVLGHRFRGKKCLILADIEGSELAMLQAASLPLSNEPKPVWMAKISVSEHQPTAIEINPKLEPIRKPRPLAPLAG